MGSSKGISAATFTGGSSKIDEGGSIFSSDRSSEDSVQYKDLTAGAGESVPLLELGDQLTALRLPTAIMERRSKLGRVSDMIAVEAEPGLTNAQLMLANHDLKPVEPERRQWKGKPYAMSGAAGSLLIEIDARRPQLRCLLDRRLLQYQHMDDRFC